MIVTANQRFAFVGRPGLKDWGWWMATVVVPAALSRGVVLLPEAGGPILTAHVNHGRWVVACPTCPGQEEAWAEGQFVCVSCLNAGNRHQVLRARFPDNRYLIEALLDRRPLPNRNWELWETVEALQAENQEHEAELLA